MEKPNIWLDGVCKKCGSLVIETSSRHLGNTRDKNIDTFDYMNSCLNPECEEYKWHYVGDMEEADYYIHSGQTEEVYRFLNKEIFGINHLVKRLLDKEDYYFKNIIWDGAIIVK